MYLDICNFTNFNNNQKKDKCLDFSKYTLTFENPPVYKEPPKILNGKTKIPTSKDNDNSHDYIWSKFTRHNNAVFSKCSMPDNSWNYLLFKRNYIQYFPYNKLCKNIRYLNLSRCHLEFVGDLPDGIIYFNASNNTIKNITRLPDSLQVLKLSNNQLENISNIPISIKKLDISGNLIKEIPEEELLLTQIRKFNYERNPIQFSQRIIDFLDTIGQDYHLPFVIISHKNKTKNKNKNYILPNTHLKIKTIYSDSQNVHNHYIYQQSKDIFKKIKSKTNYKKMKSTNEILNKYLNNKDLSKILKIFNKNNFVTILDTNLDIILQYFCNYVENICREHKKNIFKVLQSEIVDMKKICISGRLMRLFNCLSGFDETIQIKISFEQQKDAKINMILKKYKEEMGYNILTPLETPCEFFYEKLDLLRENIRINKKYIFIAESELKELGLEKSEIEKWTIEWKYDIEEYKNVLEDYKNEIDMFERGDVIKCYYTLLRNPDSIFNLPNISDELNIFNNKLKNHKCKTESIYYTDNKEVICELCKDISKLNGSKMEYIKLAEI